MHLDEIRRLAFAFNGRDSIVLSITVWFFLHLLRLFVLTAMSTVVLLPVSKHKIQQQLNFCKLHTINTLLFT